MNKQIVTLIVFATCFSFSVNNVAEGTIWGIIKESAYVIGRINTANQQMIEVVTSAVKDIGGNVTMAIGTAALGRVEDTVKFLKGALEAIHNFQTTGFNKLNNILDGMSSLISNLIYEVSGHTVTLPSTSAMTTKAN
ncbi:uncharacterized protein [Periplaneta americana]|uniref:uncharacterized protein isoform X2 n=1 Tax=Periplaneta americana TaxID=6978 RepID=UPI0037E7BF5B